MKMYLALAVLLCICSTAFAQIKYINSYERSDGTQVSGHYRDTSNDGNSFNNANTLGWNK